MNSSSIYSKTGKGVQEASGKTSQLSRGDRAILSAIDGKVNLRDLSAKFDRPADDKFFALIQKMDQDGFIREVSPGTVQRGAANAPRPAAARPPPPPQGGEELDFTQIFSAPPKVEKPPAAAPRGDPMAAARHEAEMRQRAEREAKTRADAAAKSNVDSTQRFRIDAEARAKAAREAMMAAAAEGKTQAEIDARSRAEAEARSRAAAEAKARAEAQMRAWQARSEREWREAKERVEREARGKIESAEKLRRDAEERARRDAEEKKAREEAEELRKKLEEERQARENAERRAQEEREKRERERSEEDRRVRAEEERLDAERRARDDQERKARDEQDRREQEENQRQIRLAREAEDRKRRDADARKKKEEEARRWEQEEARRKFDDTYRQRAEQEDKVRAERDALESVERAEAEKKAAEAADALSGSLLVDLDSFSARQDEEGKAKEEAERVQRAEAERRAQEEQAQRERAEAERRARKEAERQAREAEEHKAKEEEERQAREAEEHKAKEEEERRAREAEEKKNADEAGRNKREREETARKQAAHAADGDIPISHSDMGSDDVADDARKLSPEARKALRDRQREVARARSRGDQSSSKAAAAYQRKQPVKWGKPLAVALFFLLVGGVAALNFMPLSTTEYERLASDALGTPVKIGGARLWVLAGVQMRFENVSIGESVKIAAVRAVPEIDTVLGEDKVFGRVELVGVVLQQDALAAVLLGGMIGKRLRASRVIATGVKLEGPLALPALSIDAGIGRDGKLTSIKLSGEGVNGLLVPKGADIVFEATLGDFTLPFLNKFSLADFGIKGTANRAGMALSEFNGRVYDGTVVGNARVQWGAQWSVQGEIEGRGMNAAVFAPQLISGGRFDGKGRFSMSGPEPAKLYESARLDGSFTVGKGVLGSFDLARALQTTSAQSSGRTPFTELAGKASLANGKLSLRDMALTAGLLRASGTLDVEANEGLSGRVDAELRTLRGTLYIGGKLADPQLRR